MNVNKVSSWFGWITFAVVALVFFVAAVGSISRSSFITDEVPSHNFFQCLYVGGRLLALSLAISVIAGFIVGGIIYLLSHIILRIAVEIDSLKSIQ